MKKFSENFREKSNTILDKLGVKFGNSLIKFLEI